MVREQNAIHLNIIHVININNLTNINSFKYTKRYVVGEIRGGSMIHATSKKKLFVTILI